jgi:hypothetical protein
MIYGNINKTEFLCVNQNITFRFNNSIKNVILLYLYFQKIYGQKFEGKENLYRFKLIGHN